MYPVWKIIFNEKLTFKEKPTVVTKEKQEEVDWANYMDAKAMKTMMKTSGEVFLLLHEVPIKSAKVFLDSIVAF